MTTPLTYNSADAKKRALGLIRDSHSFMLVGHVRPDGDCIGAQAALSRGLLALGKEVFIVNPDEPDHVFDYLYAECPFSVVGSELPPHDVVVLLDFNDLSRCGKMAPMIEKAGAKQLVIDHHPPAGEPWWDESFIDVGASATGVLVWRVLTELGVEIDRTAAAGVFTSIVTDTGWFRYSNTDVETMEVAAQAMHRGVRPTEIFDAIYQRNRRGEVRGIAALLQRSEYFCEGKLVVVDHPRESGDLDGLTSSDAVLDILRSVDSVEVVLYVREGPGGTCKLSARSKTDYNVNALARKFGGGGHVKASGATIEGTLPDVRQRLIDAAKEGFNEG